MELLRISDKYVQNDLYEKCSSYLKYNINPENVLPILDFACHKDLYPIQGWCIKFLKANITADNIPQVIKYLNQKHDEEETIQEHLELRDKAIHFVIENSKAINLRESNLKLYEGFLIDNIQIDTIVKISDFIYNQRFEWVPTQALQQVKTNVKDALFAFAKANFKELKEKQITRKLPIAFLEDLISDFVEGCSKSEKIGRARAF